MWGSSLVKRQTSSVSSRWPWGKGLRKEGHFSTNEYRAKYATTVKGETAVDSHADGLCLFGDLPEGEEQADGVSLVQERDVRFGLGFLEGLQCLDGLFHLVETFREQTRLHITNKGNFQGALWIEACYCAIMCISSVAKANTLADTS